MLSRFLVTFCKMYRSAKKNVNCLVFLLLSCVNIRCWIKSWSDRFPLWRRVWSSRPHLAVVFFLSRVVHILGTWLTLPAGSGKTGEGILYSWKNIRMLSKFLVSFCKMYRSTKKNANCLVFLTLPCINIRCWIKSWSDCVPSWRHVWSSWPHLCCRILVL